MTAYSTTKVGRRSVNQIVGLVAGLVFIGVGLLGFSVSGGHHPVGAEGGALLGIFQVNVLHNLVHVVVGAALVLGAIAGPRVARTINALVGAVYVLVGVAGLFIVDSAANVIALNGNDNILHLLAGGALLALAGLTDRR